VACQFHPEFQSTPLKAHPLFKEFIAASVHRGGKPLASAAGGDKPSALSEARRASTEAEEED
jgi:CTP synthase